MYKGHRAETTYQERTDFPLSGFLSSNPQPEDRQRLSRREYLGLYIYTNPVERFQQEYNKSMIQKAEIIKCRRTESIINEEYGFLDRNKGKERLLGIFQEPHD